VVSIIRDLYVLTSDIALRLGIIDQNVPGIDLHDLYTLRSRSLHFIHDLVNSLRESGVRRQLVDYLSMTQTVSEL
jgi:hypothetical protein